MIAITLANAGPLPVGARVSGQATWTPESAKQPNGVKVALRWRTEGTGSTDMRKTAEFMAPLTTVAVGVPLQLPFDFALPLDGPVSYNGNLLRIIWEVFVEIDMPWAVNEKAQMPFVVVPRWNDQS